MGRTKTRTKPAVVMTYASTVVYVCCIITNGMTFRYFVAPTVFTVIPLQTVDPSKMSLALF